MDLIGIELGGTKCLAVRGRAGRIDDRVRVPTTSPGETLDALTEVVAGWCADRPVAAIGVATFGPVALDPARADHGRIGATPKPGWRGADVLAPFRRFGLPLGLDTDVAGAALAEGLWGAAQGCAAHVYLTIGTGIGGGVVVNGRPVHGLLHPEIGHIRVRRRPGAAFPGVCPHHGDCAEGLCSGPAIAARAGRPAEALPADDPLWAEVAQDLAELAAVLFLTVSPERIVIGGGIGAGQPQLFAPLRAATLAALNGYLDVDLLGDLSHRIVPAALGQDAGPLGAIALAPGCME